MMTHGGFSTEGRIMLDDFNLFDFELGKWLNVSVKMDGQEVVSDATYGAKAVEDQSSVDMKSVGARQSHCMAAVFEQDYYTQQYKQSCKES